jgi:hypothetical protein
LPQVTAKDVPSELRPLGVASVVPSDAIVMSLASKAESEPPFPVRDAVGSGISREPEHFFGDDVALDLGGAAADGEGG